MRTLDPTIPPAPDLDNDGRRRRFDAVDPPSAASILKPESRVPSPESRNPAHGAGHPANPFHILPAAAAQRDRYGDTAPAGADEGAARSGGENGDGVGHGDFR
jgi:hypothetical protein